MFDLKGKRALITGANQGIGWAIAKRFAEFGATVAVNYPEEARYPSGLAELGSSAIAIRADVSRVAEIRAMFDEIESAWGGLDILVNNAGVFPRAHALELDEATWDAVHGINLKGTFFCAQSAARMMVPVRSGRIINIASDAGVDPAERGTHYTASKAGVIGVTKGLAKELAPYHVAVNAVAPGLTDTAQPRFGMTEDEIAREGAAMPWGRIGTPDDVARAVLYLASDWSEFVTGETLFVTGGAFMSP